MPNLPQLHGLRHCWCWEARPRPYLPTWSFAKVPRLQFSPEENARLLSIYMRPWTLRESESTRYNPQLSLLGKCEKREEKMHALWLELPLDATGSAQDAASPRPLKRRMQRKESDPYKCRDKINKKMIPARGPQTKFSYIFCEYLLKQQVFCCSLGGRVCQQVLRARDTC